MGTITVCNLGKAYKHYPNRWGRLLEWLMPFVRPRHELRWVMQDVNFNISSGEAVAIVGANGAGKSTLLKMVTGTSQPTTGSVNISGRVSAMLELGMGFHPDFTGRQNAFMTGQLLGLSVEDISKLMPEIEAFSEIGDYMDQPVRIYSSGMQMRLAFSVATARRPDVLIIDEALSVGDAYFQQKSFELIRKFREQGTTLLIVSHDKSAIQSICDRAILLEKGKLAMQGEPEIVLDYYNAMIAQKENSTVEQRVLSEGNTQTISGTGEVEIESAAIHNSKGELVEIVNVGEIVTLKIIVRVNVEISELVLGYVIKDRLGQSVFGTNTHHLGSPLKQLGKGERVIYLFSFPANIGQGSYSISLALHESDSHLAKNYVWKDRALLLNIININHPEFVGVSWLQPEWESRRD